MVGIELFILWFACAGMVAFTTNKKQDKACEVENCEETKEETGK